MSQEMTICSLKSMEENGYKVAFVKGNRSVDNSNLRAKIKSLKEFGTVLTPLMYVTGDKALADGCELVNTDYSPLSCDDYSKVIVILDGQHRYRAAVANEMDMNDIYVFENYSKKTTKEILSEVNICSNVWKNKDYVTGAALFHPENELVQFCKELVDSKYSLKTISCLLTGQPARLNKSQFSALMRGEKPKFKDEPNIERAKLIIEASKQAGFSDDMLRKAYYIEAIFSLVSDSYRLCDVLKAITKLPKSTVKLLEDSTREAGGLKFIKESISKKLPKRDLDFSFLERVSTTADLEQIAQNPVSEEDLEAQANL